MYKTGFIATVGMLFTFSFLVFLLVLVGTKEVVSFSDLASYMPGETVTNKGLTNLTIEVADNITDYADYYSGAVDNYTLSVKAVDATITYLAAHCKGCGLVYGDLVGVWGRPDSISGYGKKGLLCYARWGAYVAQLKCLSKGVGLHDLSNAVVYIGFNLEPTEYAEAR